MLFKWLYIYFFGSVDIIVQGFFIERFINNCKSEKIILWSSEVENGTILKAKISKRDFKKIHKISRKTYCKVSIDSKNGLPFLAKRYKKRKSFAIAFCVIAIFCFIITRFIWNIDISGNSKLSREEILSDLAEYGICIGKLKTNLDLDMIKNEIRLKRDELAWIGIDIKGTNAIVTVVEGVEKPSIIDEKTQSNIIADKSGTISRMVVRSGTARVSVGDEVSEGDLLVEGVMEGQYTGVREVNSDADIFVSNIFKKEKTEPFTQEITERTGNIEKNVEIYINNFKINFNKGVPKFKNYDTIRMYKKVKLFSNYYIPMEIVTITNFELENKLKKYEEKELTDKITRELQEEVKKELKLDDLENIQQNIVSVTNDNGVTVSVDFQIEEKIETKER